ncbi:hypothetical protein WH47_11276 [Habropoda laboriosa]|uniref:Uncharacterized protein n=1 Tax=Habropoda laboriosa TaxID=597456 RepID=A0A0L7QKU4_9HYME|nr:PREDICTED: uncharacterized protein LOC108577877 [Habropoda laboriosa]KOC59200.1 hypothetical protein WH47_11276 [Habropoda laboriosa]
MANENIDEQILTLYSEEKWEDIVRLKCILNKTDKSKLFWVLPTFNDLRWIQELIEKYNLIGLVSIGCGCGLLEWLFKKYSGLDVIGVELDRSWWCSKYSPPLFLKNIVFISESDTNSMFLLDKHAFLFCYFNNASAFCYYIENYKGNFIFVIGPQENEDRLSDPMPLDAKFDEYNWTLIHKKELERTGDYITVYRR